MEEDQSQSIKKKKYSLINNQIKYKDNQHCIGWTDESWNEQKLSI